MSIADQRVQSLSAVRVILTVFLPFAGGYYMSYFFRSVNAVIAPNLIGDIGLSAGDLGLLTAAYFMAFAAFQIPLGLLLDRYGPPKVQFALLMTAAAGAFIFAIGDSKSTLFIGRAMIGLGVSGGLMSSFKAIVLWFPRDRIPLVNGLFMAFGGLGAMSATVPVEAAMAVTDWRGVYGGIGMATALIAFVILFLTPEKANTDPIEPLREQFKGILNVYRTGLFWRVGPLAFTSASAGMAIQGLWAGPWLRDVAGLDDSAVATHLFLIALAMTCGFAAMGVISDVAYRKWRIPPRTVMVLGVMAFTLVQIGILLEPVTISYAVWFVFGLVSNFSAMAFAVLSQHFPASLSARSNTALNVLVFASAFAGQYAVGAIIDLFPLAESGGYRPEAYQAAFGMLAAVQVLAVVWYVVAGRLERNRNVDG